jgi:hypothetical protein
MLVEISIKGIGFRVTVIGSNQFAREINNLMKGQAENYPRNLVIM